MDRRDFLVRTCYGSWAAYILAESLQIRRAAMATKSKNADTAAVLCGKLSFDWRGHIERFRDANSAELMQLYVVGFTSMSLKAARAGPQSTVGLVTEVEELAEHLYVPGATNRHRVRAFPGCAAAHLLPALELDGMEVGCRAINAAMQFPQREVQEIVIQNLISALTVSEQAWSSLWVSDGTLEALRAHIAKSSINPYLNPGSNLAVQFLIYYKKALAERELADALSETAARQSRLIDKVFADVESARHEYSWFQRQWLHLLIDVIDHGHKLDQLGRRQLPPQSSELVMGWRSVPPSHPWHRLLRAAILNNALIVYLDGETVAGRAGPEWLQRDYDMPEAGVARDKLLREWFKEIRFSAEVLGAAADLAQGPVRDTVLQLAESFPGETMPTAEWHPDWSLVPFREHMNPQDPAAIQEIQQSAHLLESVTSLSRMFAAGTTIKLAFDYWGRVAKKTPSEVEERSRPTADELNRKATEPKLGEFIESLIEGDPESLQ